MRGTRGTDECIRNLPQKYFYPGGQKGRGRPKTRRLDGVEGGLRKIGYRNLKALSQKTGNGRRGQSS